MKKFVIRYVTSMGKDCPIDRKDSMVVEADSMEYGIILFLMRLKPDQKLVLKEILNVKECPKEI